MSYNLRVTSRYTLYIGKYFKIRAKDTKFIQKLCSKIDFFLFACKNMF